jgi:hypothetical protein
MMCELHALVAVKSHVLVYCTEVEERNSLKLVELDVSVMLFQRVSFTMLRIRRDGEQQFR